MDDAIWCTPPSAPPSPPGLPEEFNLVAGVLLVMLSGLFSGLNLGLMSFTADDLGVIIEGSDDAVEVRFAKAILPLRKKGNLLLCTLLLGNTLVNVLIAELFSRLTGGSLIGTATTTLLIVIFGEIVPQSVCSRHALRIGAKSLYLVYVFVLVCFPLAMPISIVLDKLLGGEMSADYTRNELVSLIKLNVDDPERAKNTGLTESDGNILRGALTYKERKIEDVMTPIAKVFSLPLSTILDREAILAILRHGHTRIPVYEEDPRLITAILFTKDILGLGFERKMPLREVLFAFKAAHRIHRIHTSTKLDVALDKCKRDHVHMLVVTDTDPGHAAAPMVGIATIEDFIEEILQAEIVDETDVLIDAAGAGDHMQHDEQSENLGEGTPDGAATQDGATTNKPRPGYMKRNALVKLHDGTATNANLMAYDAAILMQMLAPASAAKGGDTAQVVAVQVE